MVAASLSFSELHHKAVIWRTGNFRFHLLCHAVIRDTLQSPTGRMSQRKGVTPVPMGRHPMTHITLNQVLDRSNCGHTGSTELWGWAREKNSFAKIRVCAEANMAGAMRRRLGLRFSITTECSKYATRMEYIAVQTNKKST